MSGGVKTGGGKLGNFERREGQGAKGLTTYVDGAPLAPSVQPYIGQQGVEFNCFLGMRSERKKHALLQPRCRSSPTMGARSSVCYGGTTRCVGVLASTSDCVFKSAPALAGH